MFHSFAELSTKKVEERETVISQRFPEALSVYSSDILSPDLLLLLVLP